MLEELLKNTMAYPILGHNPFEFLALDLSKHNPELVEVDVANTEEFEAYIGKLMRASKADVAYGGYNEERNIYQRSKHFNDSTSDERYIHLGMDLWAVPDTPIFSPFDARVHSMANNTGLGNYGPTIILEHELETTIFYTLYGHLTLDSLDLIEQGQRLNKGDRVAAIGNYPENGDYPPHLHFQVIKDMRGMHGDFPGVTSDRDREKDLANCPNPNLILEL